MNFHGGQLKRNGLNDFSVNIPNIPYEQAYLDFLKAHIENLMEYPEIDGHSGRKALSEAIDWPMEHIVLGNGATDLIYLTTRALKLRNVMILNPTFTEYSRALLQMGAKVTHFSLTESLKEKKICYTLETSEMVKAIVDNGCDGLFICNPNNPTGSFLEESFFESLFRALEVNTQMDFNQFVLIIDESFIEFKERDAYHQNMRRLMEQYKILVIRSMTKTYSIPGLRLGYAFGNYEVVTQVVNMREPWALNRFALESIPYFLKNKNYLSGLQNTTQLLRNKLRDQLLAFDDIYVAESETNYLFMKVNVKAPLHWHNRLIEKGFYLRTCLDFIGLGPEYFRIAVKDETTNQNLIKAIGEIENEKQL